MTTTKPQWQIEAEERAIQPQKRREKFEATYNNETTKSRPFRCCEQTDGFYTRKDGQVCTEEDIKLLYEIKTLGQETKFTLENGKVKVYGFCDSSD